MNKQLTDFLVRQSLDGAMVGDSLERLESLLGKPRWWPGESKVKMADAQAWCYGHVQITIDEETRTANGIAFHALNLGPPPETGTVGESLKQSLEPYVEYDDFCRGLLESQLEFKLFDEPRSKYVVVGKTSARFMRRLIHEEWERNRINVRSEEFYLLRLQFGIHAKLEAD